MVPSSLRHLVWADIISLNAMARPVLRLRHPLVLPVRCRTVAKVLSMGLVPFRRRERAMLGFRGMRSLQTFVSVHASVYNHFNQQRHLYSRDIFKTNRAAALNEWRGLCAA